MKRDVNQQKNRVKKKKLKLKTKQNKNRLMSVLCKEQIKSVRTP